MLKNLKKALSVVLAFCMLMSMLSMTALADDINDTNDNDSSPALESDQADSVDDEEADISGDENGGGDMVPSEAPGGGEGSGDESESASPEPTLTPKDVLDTTEGDLIHLIEGSTIYIGGVPVLGGDVSKTGFFHSNLLKDVSWNKITKVVIGGGVTTIAANAFNGNAFLTDVELCEGVTRIYNSAFMNCIDLKNVTLPDGLLSIGWHAFGVENSTQVDNKVSNKLASIEIPASVTMIDCGAFFGCANLETVTFEKGSQLTTLGEQNDKGGPFDFCRALTKIEIPDGVKRIPARSFEGCTNLTEVRFPKSLETIGAQAFMGCKGLTTLDLSKYVGLNIEGRAFDGCNLSFVVLPEKVKLAEHVFDNNNLENTDAVRIVFMKGTAGTFTNAPTFDLKGGSFDLTTSGIEPKWEEHTFLGWFAPGATESSESFEKNVIYTAHWECLKTRTEVRSASCTNDGSRTVICAVCGEVISMETIPATGHYWRDGYVVTREPAVGAPGEETRTCAWCGRTQTRSIDALAEEPVEPVDPVEPGDDPTDIPDEDPPLSEEPDDPVDIPDDDPPLSGEPDDPVDIPDDDPPLAELPDLPDEPVQPVESAVKEQPVVSEAGGEDIADGDVPLANVPQTGDGLAMWLGAAALSGAGLILVTVSERKRREKDAG